MKTAAIFGASAPRAVEHGSVPYDVRQRLYRDYVADKSQEEPTGYLKGMGGGALLGGLGGALIGAAHGAPGGGALVGGLGGAALGGIAAALDKAEVANARDAHSSGDIDPYLAQQVADMIDSRDHRHRFDSYYQNARLVDALEKRSDLDEMLRHLPGAITEVVKRAGMRTLVAAHYGLPDMSLKTVSTLIGTKLAARRAERKEITTGLEALSQLAE